MISLAATPASAAPSADKVDRLVRNGNSEKAWDLCAKTLEKEAGYLEPDLYAVCANARLAWLSAASPAGLELGQLADFWATWCHTPAPVGACEDGARLMVERAGDNPMQLWPVVLRVLNTEAGRAAIATLWAQAQAAGTSAAALAFAQYFPQTQEGALALVRARDLAFSEAEGANTPPAWRALLDAWPDHPRKVEAERRWNGALFEEAAQIDSSARWRSFLDTWPNHPRRNEAESRWHQALFREAEGGGPLALMALTDDYPSHPRALEARVRAHGMKALVYLVDTQTRRFQSVLLANEPRGEAVSPNFDSIHVLPAKEGRPPQARLALLRTGVEAEPSGAEPSWTLEEDGHLVGVLEHELCQPNGGDTWFAVIIDSEAPPQHFPFQIRHTCGE